MMRASRALGLITVGALALAACGGSDAKGSTATEPERPKREQTKEDRAYLDAVDKATTEQDEGQKGPPAKEMNCWAEAMVDAIPATKLIEAGLAPDQMVAGQAKVANKALTADEAQVVVEAFVDCIDLEAVLMPTKDDDAPAGVAECMAELDWSKLEEPFAEAMILSPEDSEAAAEAMAPINECIMADGAVESPGRDAPSASEGG